ncbi:NAD-dependent protein deacylase [Podospora australis]|uniref:NAD-dependent protein deacylase n=1 Tax=Podospora australis TaxID=1536484 RepID=A0AAN6WSE6_9PEZI|nr:NAD-dependent protein deacylase [Podospora australis]
MLFNKPLYLSAPPRFIITSNTPAFSVKARHFFTWKGDSEDKMASKNQKQLPKEYNSITAFHKKLAESKRILAVCGAGLSAASGLATFRGAGGHWREHKATDLATPGAFRRDPGLVWLFYAYRRHMALSVKPNAGHHALAALAKKNPDFLCLTQNVDNLHQRSLHPPPQLKPLHGSLFTLTCSSPSCTWSSPNNYASPLCPALAPAASSSSLSQLLDPSHPLDPIDPKSLPHCPDCHSLQRPGVVWFGEPLEEGMLDEIDRWIDAGPVDIVLVIGTSSVVYPAAGYAEACRTKGHTSVVTVNLDADQNRQTLNSLQEEDFAFAGDAAELLPELLKPVIGELPKELLEGTEDQAESKAEEKTQ